jgi:uncharacterized lipoprotein YajG
MNKLITVTGLLLITACATPETTLHNPNTGQVARCGGNVSASLAGGVLGYHIQKRADDKCVDGYQKNGFERGSGVQKNG